MCVYLPDHGQLINSYLSKEKQLLLQHPLTDKSSPTKGGTSSAPPLSTLECQGAQSCAGLG